jgi:hypothetical protein
VWVTREYPCELNESVVASGHPIYPCLERSPKKRKGMKIGNMKGQQFVIPKKSAARLEK